MKYKYLFIMGLSFGLMIPGQSQNSGSNNDTEDTLNLGEVSVNAIGTLFNVSKSGHSVSSVAGKKLVSSGESGVIQALSGKASNVSITKNSGDPGSGAFIQIRGQNTISGSNQPLIIIDGIAMSNSSFGQGTDGVVQQSRLNDLNPSDIASITVLKGAAAAAIWGTAPANGVIVITTKKGSKSGMNIEFSSTLSFDMVNKEYEKQGIYGQGNAGKWVANAPGSWGDKISNRRGGLDSLRTTANKFVADDGSVYYPILAKRDQTVFNKTNRDQVFRTGQTWINNISISSGNARSNMYFSASDWNQKGVLNGTSDYHRTTGRLNFNHMLNDKLSLSMRSFLSKSTSNRIQQGSNLDGLYLGYLRTAPDFDNTDYSGTYYNAVGVATFNSHRGYRRYLGDIQPSYNNPGWTLNKQTNTSDVTRVTVTPEIKYQWKSNSLFTVRTGYDVSTDHRITYFPVLSGGSQANGSFTDDFIQETVLNFHAINQSNFENLLGNNGINLHTTLGYIYTKRSLMEIGGTASQFIIKNQDRFAFINATSTNQNPFNSNQLLLTNQVYGMLDLDIKDKYFLQVSSASEASSTYANRFLTTGASLAYEFTKDIGQSEFLNNGKLRFSAGQIGVAPPAYIWNTNYVGAGSSSGWGETLDGTQFGGTYARSSVQGNPDIRPEQKTEFELGTDLKMLKNKLSLGITYYTNEITGIVLAVDVAPSSGYSSQWKNAASMTNKGVEIDMNLNLVATKDLNLNLYGNLSSNKNNVTDLSGTNSVFLAGFTGTSSRVVKDHAMGVFWGGMYEKNEGKLVLDANGFPQAAVEEGVSGDPNAKYRASIGMNGNYKELTFNMLFETSQGNQMWGGTSGVLNYFGISPETATEVTLSQADADKVVDYSGKKVSALGVKDASGNYTVRGSLKDFGKGDVLLNQAWYQSLGGGFGPVNEDFINDASWVRLRELSLSYKLPRSICDLFHIPSASVGFTGRNLLLWTPFKGVDPELNLTGVSNGRGLDYFTNPGTKSYMFNIKFNL